MLHILEHTLSHTIEDSVKLLPFLFFTYLLMELLEHTTAEKCRTRSKMQEKSDRCGVDFLELCRNVVSRQQRPAFMPDESLRWERCLPYFCRRRMRCFRFFISEAVAPATIIKNSCSKSLHCDRFRISCRTGLCECFQKERKRHGHPCGL